jgi:hypothetical protein
MNQDTRGENAAPRLSCADVLCLYWIQLTEPIPQL